jgi:hypothetical protein
MQGSPALLQISPFLHDLVCGEREEKGRLTDSFEPVRDKSNLIKYIT